MDTVADNALLRELDSGERFIWLVDRFCRMNFVAIVELEARSLSAQDLRRGLDRLQANHPLLAARVVTQPDGRAAFHTGGIGPIPLLIDKRREEDWLVPVLEDLDTTFHETDLPLARCRLIELPERTVLSMPFDHVITDGRSCLALIKELLRSSLRGVDRPAEPGVPPPMHSLFPSAFRWGERPGSAEGLARQVAEEALVLGSPAELPFLAHETAERRPMLRQIRLDADRGRRLQARCREQAATVHGAICAAQLIATYNLLEADGPETMYLVSPADMRGHLTDDLEGRLSFCSTLVRSTYKVAGKTGGKVADADAFWDLAREVAADLKRRLQRGEGHLTFAALPLDRIGTEGPAFDAFVGALAQLPAGSAVSNLGRIEPLDDCPEVRSISFAFCGMPKHLATLILGSYRDELTINMNYDAAKCAPELMERLARDVEALLDRAAA